MSSCEHTAMSTSAPPTADQPASSGPTTRRGRRTVTRPAPEFAAAVDLGSNSFHMIVGRLAAGQLHVVDKLRERVRFASGLDEKHVLSEEAMVRALDCLKRLGQRVADMPPGSVRAVGTNTLRKARNSRVFMERARDALGHPIEIIGGREEARLIYLGVAQTMPSEGGKRLVVDIGGGSTEFIIGDGFKIVEADSLFMGCVSFSLRYFGDGKLTAKRFRDAKIAAELELQSLARNYRKIGWTTEIGCSGTIHAVDAIVRANGWAEEGITLKALKKLRKALVAAGSVDALSLPGLQPDRMAVIAGGTAILEALFEDLRVNCMVPSPGALREGVLYDLVGRFAHEDVRDRTINWFCDHYHADRSQSERVEETALNLLDHALKSWPLDEERATRLLSWASSLSEIGLAIAHTAYHKHSAYLIENSHMAGFARGEQRALATLVRCHRRKLRTTSFDEIDPKNLEELQRLCVLFRLAVCLNRSRDADIPNCVLRVKKKRLKITFPDGWLEARPLSTAALEQEAIFLKALDFELVVKTADTAPSVAPEP